MFTNTNMNWNGCRSHVKVSKNEESIPEYLELITKGREQVLGMNFIIMNSDSFSFSFQVSTP